MTKEALEKFIETEERKGKKYSMEISDLRKAAGIVLRKIFREEKVSNRVSDEDIDIFIALCYNSEKIEGAKKDFVKDLYENNINKKKFLKFIENPSIKKLASCYMKKMRIE